MPESEQALNSATASKVVLQNMEMPDMAAEGYPDQYRFDPAIEKFHLELPERMMAFFKCFGAGDGTEPPAGAIVPQISPDVAAGIPQYTALVSALRKSFDELHATGAKLVPLLREAEVLREQGQRAIDGLVASVNAAARMPPKDLLSENEHIMGYVTAAIDGAETEIRKRTDGFRGVGKEIDAQTKAIEDAVKKQREVDEKQLSPPEIPKPKDEIRDIPTPITAPMPLFDEDVLDTDRDDPAPSKSRLSSELSSAIDSLKNSAQAPAPAAMPNAGMGMGTGSGMGSGMDMMSSMLPQIMRQQYDRSLADDGMNDRPRDIERPRQQQDSLPAPTPIMPPTAATATQPSPTAAPQTSSPSASHPATAVQSPTGETNQPPATPARTVASDGSVLYTFPDGRTQKVSEMVAQVLDAAFSNASSTNAQEAFGKTEAKWTDRKKIGRPVDPFELMTGDVAIWDRRTAVVVVFGSDEGGTLEVIVHGELKEFAAEMSDSAGEFGQFSGFAHPNGIELRSRRGADTATGGTTPGDQSTAQPSAALAAPVG
ncbi:hypothetical protein NN3_23320 [Nocardia neocaledoniensis NBRC 108232]|uniref:Uncharacterized protein n=1 Tax=Nocardia neocaledoniensis TaxID=236511 RepID=A0A317N0R2_9NOCA|nr:hypothetical protein [Nocardia neocaledoniensis]PWV66938.1 hypothetical protein DFR69_1223 [Nocardia neocaledoniensis]GEM31325.1 hypothetical protein NN3_23320 [Nocardia neocaledoniensis NBRC 108232]